MGLEPVLAKAGICHEGNVQGEGVLHLFDDNALHFLLFLRIDGEVEFVVYLQDHLTLDALFLEAFVDADHRNFDDVCRCALDGGIDGVTLSKTSDGGIVGIDVRQIATTAE